MEGSIVCRRFATTALLFSPTRCRGALLLHIVFLLMFLPTSIRASAQATGDTPDVRYRPFTETRPLSDTEEAAVDRTFHWSVETLRMRVGETGKAEVLGANNQPLATMELTWVASEPGRLVNAIEPPSSKWRAPQKAQRNSAPVQVGQQTDSTVVYTETFRLRMSNSSTCDFQLDSFIEDPTSDAHFVTMGLEDLFSDTSRTAYPGTTYTSTRSFIEFARPQDLLLRLRVPYSSPPLWACRTTDTGKQALKKATYETIEGPSESQSPALSNSDVKRRISGDCSWSPEFDQLRTPEQIAKVKGANFRELVQQGGVPIQQQIAAGQQLLAQLQSQLVDLEQTIHAISDPPVTDYSFTFDYQQICSNASRGALMAAECQHIDTEDMLHITKGTIAILQCMANGI